MHRRFICYSQDKFGGFWGTGDSVSKALAALKKVSKKRGNIEFTTLMFTSELPFAPLDREAKEDEADAWVTASGGYSYIRCDVTNLG